MFGRFAKTVIGGTRAMRIAFRARLRETAMAQAYALNISGTRPLRFASATQDHWGDLMAAAQAGNGGAYNRLLTELSGWLQRYYSHRVPVAQVDDLVQEALVAVHSRRHTYEAGRPFRAWLAGIARYKWIDRLRSNSRDRSEPMGDHDPGVDDHGSEVLSRIALASLLNRLKPAQARAIQLVKLDGLSVEEAAAASGQSVSLIKVNIHRGVARLADFLKVPGEQHWCSSEAADPIRCNEGHEPIPQRHMSAVKRTGERGRTIGTKLPVSMRRKASAANRQPKSK
jgi:RNA polymerase sigma-70 factor (ECF subfamily)